MGANLENPSVVLVPVRSLNIEGLPIETQTAILRQVPDIRSLKNLVHASPVLYNVYGAQRVSILQAVLELETGLCSPHALAVIEASSLERDTTQEDYQNSLGAFYQRYRTGQQIQNLSSDQTFALLRLHRVVSLATEAFCASATHPTSGSSAPVEALSSDEDMRIRRAFYRYQTYCILANPTTQSLFDWDTPNAPPSCRPKRVESKARRTLDANRFLAGYPSRQEIEEIICIYDFLVRYYIDTLMKYRDELGLCESSESEDDTSRQITKTPSGMRTIASGCLRDGLYFFQRIEFSSPSTQLQLLSRHDEPAYHLGTVLMIRYKRECPQPAHEGGLVPSTKRYYEYTPTGSEYANPSAGWWIPAGTKDMFPSDRLLSFRRPNWIYVLWDESRLQKWGLIRA
ncbi:MAG: hypothetical protein LQ337_008431 [Flavoplaca oasis]|nr:MAG: hypothetical protein LQ337_008431 [Flavoplaca oasis]